MEQRRTQRFVLDLPVSVVCSGVGQAVLAGHTRNISSTGVLFTTDGEPEVRGAIEYVIRLIQDGKRPVSLRCMGKVVRLERAVNGHREPAPGYQVAATLERYEFVRP
jgi:hypothetical protein